MKKFLAFLLASIMSLSMYTTAFAGVGDAHFCGGYETGNSPDIVDKEEPLDTREEMNNVEFYLSNLNFDFETLVNPNASQLSNDWLNSDFLYIAGHGDRNSVNTGYKRGINLNKVSGYSCITDFDFSNVQCAILAACGTGDAEYHCLGRVIYDNGANFVLGWQKEIQAFHTSQYTEEFARNLVRGRSYLTCANITETRLLNDFGIFPTAGIFSSYMIGNYNSTLDDSQAAKSVKSNDEPIVVDNFLDDRLEQYVIEDSVSVANGDYSQLETYIQENIDSFFSLDNYKVYEGNETGGVVLNDFKLKIGDTPTNYGLTVLCIDGNAALVTLTNNHKKVTIENPEDVRVNFSNQYDDETLFTMAIEADAYTDCTVKDQSITKYYDVETNELVYLVTTVYDDAEGLEFASENQF